MLTKGVSCRTTRLLSGILASSFIIPVAWAQSGNEPVTAAADGQAKGGTAPIQTAALLPLPGVKAAPRSSSDWRARQGLNVKRNWGVEVVGIKPVSSGYMLAFRYRILDPDKAKMLNDRKSKAYVIDEATGTRLAVPAMEKVGELRVGSKPETDRTYFMIFGNPGKLVKSGNLVSIVVGNFKVDGLMVD